MTVHCHKCGSCNLRPAHFRLMDLIYLVGLHSPVRCRYCRTRFYVSILKIGTIRRDAEVRRSHERYGSHLERMAGSEHQRVPD